MKKKFRRDKSTLSGDLILIVCEGAITEPEYFKELKSRWKIIPLQVQICGKECGSDPVSVVQYAIKERSIKSKSGGLPYDQVWCVIDQDQHPNLQNALHTAKTNNIYISLSCPCFEFWYLLHFVYTTKSFQNADSVISELKQQLPGQQYDKAKPPMNDLLPKIRTALENAEKVRKSNEVTFKNSPATGVDLLVKELIKIKHVDL